MAIVGNLFVFLSSLSVCVRVCVCVFLLGWLIFHISIASYLFWVLLAFKTVRIGAVCSLEIIDCCCWTHAAYGSEIGLSLCPCPDKPDKCVQHKQFVRHVRVIDLASPHLSPFVCYLFISYCFYMCTLRQSTVLSFFLSLSFALSLQISLWHFADCRLKVKVDAGSIANRHVECLYGFQHSSISVHRSSFVDQWSVIGDRWSVISDKRSMIC